MNTIKNSPVASARHTGAMKSHAGIARSVTALVAVVSFCSLQPLPAAEQKTTPVTVTNGPTNPAAVAVQNTVGTVAVDNPAFQPFAKSSVRGSTTQPGTTLPDDSSVFTVPAGKRLVLELVTANVNIPAGQNLAVADVYVTTNGELNKHQLTYTRQGTDSAGRDIFAITQALRLYADPGTNVSLHLARTPVSGALNWTASLSGYLVDAP